MRKGPHLLHFKKEINSLMHTGALVSNKKLAKHSCVSSLSASALKQRNINFMRNQGIPFANVEVKLPIFAGKCNEQKKIERSIQAKQNVKSCRGLYIILLAYLLHRATTRFSSDNHVTGCIAGVW